MPEGGEPTMPEDHPGDIFPRDTSPVSDRERAERRAAWAYERVQLSRSALADAETELAAAQDALAESA